MARNYFHFSDVEFDVGKELLPSGKFCISPEIEKILENCKPEKSISRKDAVFLSEDQNFSGYGFGNKAGYIYQVEVSDGTDAWRVDATWVSIIQHKELVQKYDHPSESKYEDYLSLSNEELASKYWECLPTNTPNWEVLVSQARITNIESREPILASATNTDSSMGKIYTALNKK